MSVFRVATITLCLFAATAVAGATMQPARAWIGNTPLARVLKRVVGAPKAERGAGAPFAPSVAATMTDALQIDSDGDGKADPGDRIRYTTAIANTGADPATGVTLNATIDAKTTLVGGSIVVSPLAANESYNSVGNMTLTTSAIGGDCVTAPTRSVLCNDTLTNNATLVGFGATQGTANGTVVNDSNTVTTSNGGTVLLNATGTFVYNPAAGYEGTDSFWYTVSNAAGSDNAQVSITVGGVNGMVWFVTAAGSGSGTQTAPISLNSLRAINNGSGTNPAANDTIFLFEGTHALTATLTLLTNQKLFGQDINGVTLQALGAPSAQSGNSFPALDPAGGTVSITSSAAAITLGADNELAGFTIGNSTPAITGTAAGALNVRDVVINSNGGGLSISTSVALTTTAPFTGFTSITSSGGANGISLLGATGTLALGSGALSGASGATFNVSGGSATITYSGTISQGSNAALVSIAGGNTSTVTFTGAVSATNGTGLQFDNADGTYNFNGGLTLNGGDAGIDITNGSSGTFAFGTAPLPAALTNPSGIAFRQDSSTANVTYTGTITKTNNANSAISINAKTNGTNTFAGAISASTSTANAITLTNNTGGTIAFTGGMSLTTSSGVGFNATGGGTVTATQNNSSILNTITSTTGRALNVSSTTIGAAGLTFRSISSAGAPNGILLSSTGSGAFTVEGHGASSGANTTRGRTTVGASGSLTLGSGGTISSSSGVGVSLATVGPVVLRNMTVSSGSNDGINIATGTSLTLDNVRINAHAAGHGLRVATVSGLTIEHTEIESNATNAGLESSDTWNVRATELTGTGSITNSLIRDTRENVMGITNNSGTLNLTVTNVKFADANTSGVGSTALLMSANTTAQMSLTATNSEFSNIYSTGFQYAGNNSSGGGTISISGSTFSQNAIDIDIAHQGLSKTVSFNVSNNTMRQTLKTPSSVGVNIYLGSQANSGTTLQGTIANNTIGNAGVTSSGGTSGISIHAETVGTLTAAVTSNTIRQTTQQAILTNTAGTHSGRVNVTVTGNNASSNTASVDAHGYLVDSGGMASGTRGTICMNFGSNVQFIGNASGVGIGVVASPGVVELQGYAGAQNNDSQLISFLNTRATTVNPSSAVLYDLGDGNPGMIRTASSNCPTPTVSAMTPTPYYASAPLDGPASRDLRRASGLDVLSFARGLLASAQRVPAQVPGASVAAAANRAPVAPLARLGSVLATARATVAHAWTSTASVATRTARAFVDGMSASLEARSGETVNQSAGTIPANKTVRVIFDVTVDSPPIAQYSTQGTVSGSNFSSILTDDTALGGSTDPTITPGDRFNTSTALISARNPAYQGESITFTATVTPTEGTGLTPDGTVQFKDGASNIGSAVTCAAAGETCTAALTTTTLATGTRSITAVYSGGVNHEGSTGGPLSQVNTACTSNPVVVNNNNTGAGSFRQAAADACPGSTITFDMNTVTSPLLVQNVQIELERNVTITGPGANVLTLSRTSGDNSILWVMPGVTVSVSDLTIANGNVTSGGGGGIRNRGTLTVTNSAFTGNVVTGGGGAIANDGNSNHVTLNVSNSTFSGNTAGGGGAIDNYAGGGIFATVTLSNVTISGNNAKLNGGGLSMFEAPGGNASATLTNVTITNNRADSDGDDNGGEGGGISLESGTSLTLRNTIVAGNFDGTGSVRNDVTGALAGGSSFSLIGDGTSMTGVTNGTNNNQVGTGAAPISPRLAALANNGGVTQTHALLPGSPALDAGDNTLATNAGLTTDQRGTGYARSRDAADADTTQTADIGAFEADPMVEDIGDKTTAEDTPQAFTFNVGDSASAFTSITATSGNTTLLPNANAVISADTASSRTLTLTPVANLSGTAVVTVTVTKTINSAPVTATDTFTLTVTAVADAPSVTNATTRANLQTTSGLVITPNDADSAEVTHFRVSNISGGALFQNDGSTAIADGGYITVAQGGAGLKFTPTTGSTATGTFDVQSAIGESPTNISGATQASVTVDKHDTTTTITSDEDDASDQDVAITVVFTVVSATGGPTPTGNVVITTDGDETCTATVADGQCDLVLTSSGTRTLTATYQGDSLNNTSSDTEDHTVNACVANGVVTSTDDDGPGTLRQAIADACLTGGITFDIAGDGPHTILLADLLYVDKNLTITGPANESVALDGDATYQIVMIDPDVTVTLSRLNIVNGYADFEGGGVTNFGTLTILDSAIAGNYAEDAGGGITNFGVMTIRNSTISNNSAFYVGGGIFNCDCADLTLLNVTVTQNMAGENGGGLYNTNTASVKNSIIADNLAFVSGDNVVDDEGGVTTDLGNNILSGNPHLADLMDNGGPTLTHALLARSPALDAGDNTAATAAGLTTDQRGAGFGRQRDAGDVNTTQTVDIGAFEADPSIQDIANKTTSEDTPHTFTFHIGDAASAFGSIVGTSNNTTLLPDANIVVDSDTASSRTLTLTPAPNQSGTVTVTVTVTKTVAGITLSMDDTFVLTVNAVDDLPTLNAISDPAAILEDAGQQTVNLAGISAGGGEAQALEVTASSSNTGLIPNPTVTYTSPDATGSLTYTPVANKSGSAVITVTVIDAGGQSLQRTFTVAVTAVNDQPTLNAISNPAAINEDAGQQTVNLSGISDGGAGENQTLTVTATSDNTALIPNPTVTYTSPNATGSLAYTPVANASGTAVITVTVSDGGGGTETMVRTFTVTVNAVDDTPTLDAISNPAAILEDAGQQTVNLAGISAGGGESQALTVTAASDNTALIPNPTVTYTSPNATGSLAYTPVANQSGTAVITVTVTDAGTLAVQRTFTVTVTSVNDQPTLDAISNPAAINEDAGQQTVNLAGISAGGGESQTLTVTATSDNTGLIPNPTVNYTSPNATGSLTYTPVANASGTAVITVTVNDGGGGTETRVRTFTVTVNAVDDVPTLNAIANPAAIDEDAGQQTVNLSGISAGGGESQTLTVTATSNNTSLIPNPTVTYTSPDATGSLAYTPVANANGSAIITVTVTDTGAVGFNTTSRTFTVTVNAVDDAPTLDAIANPAAILEDAGQQTVNLSGITAGGGESQALTVTATSNNTGLIPNPTVTYTSPNATGSLAYTPVANASGSAVITVTVTDAGTLTTQRTFTVTVTSVNDQPTLNAISNPAAILEDAGQQTVGLSGISDGGAGEGQTLTVTATSDNTALIPNPTVTYTSPNATGSLAYTPVANASGTAVITVTVNDGGGGTETMIRTFTVTVTAVDDNPTLNAIADPAAILEDAGQQTVNLAGITAGGGESQTLTVTAASNNTALIPNPTVTYTSPNATGSLAYTPVANASGSAVITVTVTDAGNLTVQRTFTVTVTQVNDQPTLNAIANPGAIDEDAGAQTVNLSGISDGGAGENQTLTVTATSNNTGLIPNPSVTYTSPNATGSLTYTPVANASGTAVITVTVNDGGGGTETIARTFTVTVNAVDDVPTLNAIANPAAIDEDAGQQTVSLGGITAGGGESQTLTVTATSNNTALIPNPTVTYTSPNATGSLAYTPVANANGSAVITVTVTDTGAAGLNTTSRTFTVVVNAVDDVPTLDAIANPAAILEDAAQQTVNLTGITAGGGESQALTVTATSNNTSLIPNPAVTYTSPNATGSLAYTPVANAHGSAVITVTVTDTGADGLNTTTRTFTVTVTSVNDQPTLAAIADPAAILEDAAAQTVNLTGISDGGAGENQTLTVTATSNNTALIPNPTVTYTSPNATGSLTYTPVANQNGTAVITVTVSDGGGGSETVQRTFTVTVTAVDDPPTLDAIADPSAILEDAGQQTIDLAGISAGPNESQPPLTVTATSNNTALIPNPTVTYTSPNATGSLAYTPVANKNGTAVITVTVTDQGAANNTFSRTFTVTVTSVNDQPTLNAIADPAAIAEDAPAQTVNLSGITDGGAGENQTLTVTATSNNTALIPNPAVTYTSPNATGSLTYTPVADATGTAVITVTVNDGGGGTETIVRTFTVTVNPVDDVPTLNPIANPAAIDEDAGAQTVNLSGISAGGGETDTLTVTATSNNTGLIPNPTVTYTSPNATGSLSYTPVANQSGTAVITVTVTDTGGAGLNTTSRTFTVTVTSINDQPTLDAIANPAAILEDAAVQTVNLAGIAAGGGETQTLTVTATSNNTALIPNPTVTYTSPNATGSLSYTPVANANGSAVITVTVTDNGGTANGALNSVSRTFTVNVTAVNDAPTLNAIANPAAILEDAAQQTVGLAGIAAGPGETQTLTVTATSNNTGLIPNPTVTYTSPNATGSLAYTPVADQSGTAVITVTVTDNGGTADGGVNTFARTFTVTVTAVNDVPTLTSIPNPPTIVEDDLSTKTVNLTGIGAGGGETQTLTVTATSNNPTLIPNPTVTYTSPNATGTLSFAALANNFGTAVITVTVTDSGGTANGGVNTFARTFTVTVLPVNDPPTISAIPNQTIPTWSTTGPLPVTLTDIDSSLDSLTLSATSTNTTLVPVSAVTFGGSGGARTVTVTPSATENGVAAITVTVSDGELTATTTFTVTVEPGASERLIVGLGPFPSDGGWLPTRGEGVSAIAPRRWARMPWDAYNAINGELHPAVGNVDADALDEVVVGFGNGGGGWIAVLDDAAHDYAVLKWIQVQWPDYIATTGGSVWPAVGDLDGDGRAEIVAGLGTGSGGHVEIFDDAAAGFAHVGWRQLAWNDYNALNGETHPAVGDVDGDGRAEIILGTAAGGRGYLEVMNGTAPYANRRWLQVGWNGYNTAVNGPTFPAAGDLDGDGRAEILIGLGSGGGGWLELLDDAVAGFASVRWLRVDWGAYNGANGETHPAIGRVDGDLLPEIVVGLGTASGQGGWVAVFDDSATNYSPLPWVQVAWTAYVAGGGATYPAIGRLR